ncbi:TspO/MBR family protein [Methylobacterium persicinum]|uniref:Tryptophan-rich sensory protein n=1 Tax=Methylobacterium persicinum TaxID=374426 RepID=A0ABU0HES5_9HYPH|nr:TspO/MBR family protein [Methylobacterium persicinum]MDQ0440828.1 tryptophan-rich sensory protein [Methylobacterium persicinum]GJE36725.1 Tryptophan-rich protein TspO [Methylobacterium persicinum]
MPAATHVPEGPAMGPWLRLACAVLPVAATAVIGSVSTQAEIFGWYAGLAKPWFNPPDWVFPVAWTILYTMIAIALWRLLGARPLTGPSRGGWRLAVAAFAVQIALNAAWTPVFFSAHAVGLGLIVVAALLVMVLWTIRLTWRFDRAAAWLLIPYAAWVAFATILNAAILRLN